MEHLLTYEDCLKLVSVYDNFNYRKKDYYIDGFRVTTFNYFLCDYDTFINPLKSEPQVTGLDARGITFVFNSDDSLYKRFFMLKKFFNLNQVESTQYDIVKNKKISNITIKEDGSLIAFMYLPNGKIFAKTQAGFDNEQSIEAMKLYNINENLQIFIKSFLYLKNETPMFEYVARTNRIVIEYNKTDLIFIGSRNNITGVYKNATYLDNYRKFYEDTKDIRFIKSIKDKTLDDLIEQGKTEKEIEGWVVEFNDGQLVKLKTISYWNLHNIRTVSVYREDIIIEYYLKEKLDDISSVLDPIVDADAFTLINKVINVVNKWIKDIDYNVNELVKKYILIYKLDIYEFYKLENKQEFFGLFLQRLEGNETYNKRKIQYMLKESYKLESARKIVKKYTDE